MKFERKETHVVAARGPVWAVTVENSPLTAKHRRNAGLVRVVRVVKGKIDITDTSAFEGFFSSVAALARSLGKLRKYLVHPDTFDHPFDINSLTLSQNCLRSGHALTNTGPTQ